MRASRRRTRLSSGDASGELHDRLLENRATFRHLVERAHGRAHDGAVDDAVHTAAIAAHFASRNHTGMFTDRSLEGLLVALGPEVGRTRRSAATGALLHVVTETYEIGGHTRMLERWIDQDHDHRHSVAATLPGHRFARSIVPLVGRSGGEVVELVGDGPTGVAADLVRRSRSVDAVILHVHPFDPVPLLAFGAGSPCPIAFVDHADHAFWLGLRGCDLVLHLRDAGRQLGRTRRGIRRTRGTILPIPLGRERRAAARADARRAAGLDADAIVLGTMGSDMKFRRMGGRLHLTDLVEPVLAAHGDLLLVAVGPEHDPQWDALRARFEGRVVVRAADPDPSWLLDAIDVFLAPHPFASNTASLEAGARGVPVLSFTPDGAEPTVLATGSPGLEATSSTLASTVDGYRSILEALVSDPGLRATMGRETADAVDRHHAADAWRTALSEGLDRLEHVAPHRVVRRTSPGARERALDLRLVELGMAGPATLDDIAQWQLWSWRDAAA